MRCSAMARKGAGDPGFWSACRPNPPILKKKGRQLQASYMQDLHNLMPGSVFPAPGLTPMLDELRHLEDLYHAACPDATLEHFDRLVAPDFWETWRMTLWRHDGERWQAVYHQGTVVSA